MGCCIVAIALISQLFALWRRCRSLLGLPVREWYDDGPVVTASMIWRQRFQAITGTTAGRSVLAAVVVGELAFAAVILPGADGSFAQHREHIREAVELVSKYGQWPNLKALICRTQPPVAASAAPAPAHP
jgi:hypothetical protein